jgi:hypothetical protein
MTDEEIIRTMWTAGAPADEIAARIGVHRTKMHAMRRMLGIPDRDCKYRRRYVDPTPEEIEERAKAIRERRVEPCHKRVEARHYGWNGRSWDVIS